MDESGRRARAVFAVGLAIASLFALWLGGLALGMVGTAGFAGSRLAPLASIARADALADRSEVARRGDLDGDHRSARGSCAVIRVDAGASLLTRDRAQGAQARTRPASPAIVVNGPSRACPSSAARRRDLRLT